MRIGPAKWVVERHVATIWHQAPVPLRRTSDWMLQMSWDSLVDCLLVVSGWLDVRFLGQAGHFVGVTWSAEVRCPRFVCVMVDHVEGATRKILRKMPFVEEFRYFLMPRLGAEGEWPSVQPLPPGTPC